MSEVDFQTLGDWSDTGPRVAALLMRDTMGRVALHLRDDIPTIPMPGHWSAFGGHVEDGETLAQAAVRELQEETGVVAQISDLKPLTKTISPNGTRLFFFQLTKPVDPAEIRLGEGAGFGFFNADQIAALKVLPAILRVLEHYFDSPPASS